MLVWAWQSAGEVTRDGEIEAVSADVRATLAPDGERFVEARIGAIAVRDLHRAPEEPTPLHRRAILASRPLPLLGMAKYGNTAWISETRLVVLTDAYTVAEVDVERL